MLNIPNPCTSKKIIIFFKTLQFKSISSLRITDLSFEGPKDDGFVLDREVDGALALVYDSVTDVVYRSHCHHKPVFSCQGFVSKFGDVNLGFVSKRCNFGNSDPQPSLVLNFKVYFIMRARVEIL